MSVGTASLERHSLIQETSAELVVNLAETASRDYGECRCQQIQRWSNSNSPGSNRVPVDRNERAKNSIATRTHDRTSQRTENLPRSLRESLKCHGRRVSRCTRLYTRPRTYTFLVFDVQWKC